MLKQIERLNDLLRSRLQEIENLKITIRGYEEKLGSFNDANKQRES